MRCCKHTLQADDFLTQLFPHEGDVALGLVVGGGNTFRQVESAEERLHDLPAPRCIPQSYHNNERVFYAFKFILGLFVLFVAIKH